MPTCMCLLKDFIKQKPMTTKLMDNIKREQKIGTSLKIYLY